MSRIGKQPIELGSGVEVKVEGQVVTVKGPKGTLTVELPEPITAKVEGTEVLVERPNDERDSRALHGLARTLVFNAVEGVTNGYTKTLEVVGTGYRAIPKGSGIEFSLGFSHPVVVEAPEGIEFEVPSQSEVIIKGIDKQLVGETAANIQKLRKPEPYKGKGIRYKGQIVRLKAGKAGA